MMRVVERRGGRTVGEPLIVALAVSGCLACFIIFVGSIFVVLLLLQFTEHQSHDTVPPGPAVPLAANDRGGRDLAVDPQDAAWTDQMLQELLTASGIEDW